MRRSFIGYYPPTESELNQIWDSGIIVLDANVLLNLYRYSKEARRSLLGLITDLKDRLWLPYQVALEYHRNRLPLIHGERKNCDDFLVAFRKMLTTLDESRRHPFVSSSFRAKLDDVVSSLEAEIKPTSDELEAFKRSDPILDQITKLYEGKVGAEPDAKTKDSWLAEGEERYRQGIPPGFEDRKKVDERKYGDLLVWKEILAFATEKKVPVMFVTDDAKKDWWREQNGETVGPNPLLIAEIVAAVGRPFHMYRSDRFVQMAGERIKKPVPEKVVQEVRNVRAADRASAREIEEFEAARDATELNRLRLAATSFNAAMKVPEYSAAVRAAMGMPDYSAAAREMMKMSNVSEAVREAMRMPDYSAAAQQMMKMSNVSEAVRQAMRMPDYSAAAREAMKMSNISEAVREAMRVPDYSAAAREIMRMSNISEAVRNAMNVPDYSAAMRHVMSPPTFPAAVQEAARAQQDIAIIRTTDGAAEPPDSPNHIPGEAQKLDSVAHPKPGASQDEPPAEQ